MKLSDKIIFGFVIIFIAFGWGYYAFESFIMAIIIAIICYILIKTAYGFWLVKKKSIKNIGAYEMCQSFSLLGLDEAAKLIMNALPPNMAISQDCQYIEANYKEGRILIVNNYKFSNTSEDDVARAYRKAKVLKINEVYILSRLTDRKVMIFAANLDISFKFPDKKTVRRYLIDRNAMPPSFNNNAKVKKPPFNYKEAVGFVLDERRIKYYFFSGTLLFLISFITPLRLYYIILATIPLGLAGLSALNSLRQR